jgi:hypothetical protein
VVGGLAHLDKVPLPRSPRLRCLPKYAHGPIEAALPSTVRNCLIEPGVDEFLYQRWPAKKCASSRRVSGAGTPPASENTKSQELMQDELLRSLDAMRVSREQRLAIVTTSIRAYCGMSSSSAHS